MIALRRIRVSVLAFAGILFAGTLLSAQGLRGELRIEVQDQHGAALAAAGELEGRRNQVRRSFRLRAESPFVLADLPFGAYRLRIAAQGFAPWTNLVEVRSDIPVRVSVRLGLAIVVTDVEVSGSHTLIDPQEPALHYAIGQEQLSEALARQPGRAITDVVADLPGWIYESNGVLHPRGSEYDILYVVDGQPFTQNRSPAFAPAFDADNVTSLQVLTSGYPAEYGRKLGGVVEVNTKKEPASGLHGQVDINGGSFSTATVSPSLFYLRTKDSLTFAGELSHSDRYMDPPVLANFSNRGSSTDLYASFEHDFSDRERLSISLTRGATHFLVPNYLVQQNAGQEQEVADTESNGKIFFQREMANLLWSVSGSLRDEAATLSSNALSTPVIVAQDRGYREGYVRGDLARHRGLHNWKVGADGLFNPVREHLGYRITDPSQFDPNTRPQFQFADHRWDVESSAYVQDQVSWDRWNLSAGVRFDYYSLVVRKSAWSPRVSVSRYIPGLKLVVHGSYDRVFQIPAVENLLLASSPQLDAVNSLVVRLPIQPADANFYEFGIAQALFSRIKIGANLFRRDFHNYSDDDVLLDTGVSFPIAFARARIRGEELRVEVPRWGRFSGYLSYANQVGEAHGPVTGGLFLGNDAVAGLTDTSRFRISQDQRNTAHAQLRLQTPKRTWFALGAQYGSGLPAEIDDPNRNLLLAQYGAAILDRVNLKNSTVRPNISVDAAAGIELYHHEQRGAAVQLRVANITDRVNVINFTSLFSGTGVAPPRSIYARARVTF